MFLQHPLPRDLEKKLWSSRREDPEISIDLNCDQDVFEVELGRIVAGKIYSSGKQTFTIHSNRLLNSVLIHKWDERILNLNGDFAYVVEGTIRYWLGKRSPIIEYKYVK